MKNKINLKATLTKLLIVVILSLVLTSIVNSYEYKKYQQTYNNKVNSILNKIEEKYPNITKDELFEIINSKDKTSATLKSYGIAQYDTVLQENTTNFKIFFTINLLLLIITIATIIMLFLKYNYKKDQELKAITNYIEEINNKNYKLYIDDISEDELSILKNELYKTTVMLKEQAENSKKDKLNLKDSLSDISHQLKTPLTSILIMLDNIIDNPEMDEKTRTNFVKDIKRDILNINLLVQALLKLSKLDSNTIVFTKEDTNIETLISSSIENVSNLADLKDITIIKKCNTKKKIMCDSMWQKEAITNILKNALEYSTTSSQITIETTENTVYSEIKITNYGKIISKEDLPHIFERFYKGKNSSSDSVGIGLALSKTIIEKDNGRISVESTEDDGTTFTIKYFHITI